MELEAGVLKLEHVGPTRRATESRSLTRNLRHLIPTGVACHDPLATLPPDA